MENWIIWLIFAGIFCALLVLHVAAGSKKPFRRALGSALNGLVALVLVNITGGFTGVTLPVSLLSLGVSEMCIRDRHIGGRVWRRRQWNMGTKVFRP